MANKKWEIIWDEKEKTLTTQMKLVRYVNGKAIPIYDTLYNNDDQSSFDRAFQRCLKKQKNTQK